MNGGTEKTNEWDKICGETLNPTTRRRWNEDERKAQEEKQVMRTSEQVGETGDLDEASIVCGLIGELNAARRI